MKIKDLIDTLESLPENAEIVIANDEELNTIYKEFEICNLTDQKNLTYCIFGLSGTELEENFNEEED